MARIKKPETTRPMPPPTLGQFGDADTIIGFAPALDLEPWVRARFIDEEADLHNADHQHLMSADVAFLWAAGGFVKAGNVVVGQCEELTFRCGPWQKGRQVQQMEQWFGRVPTYLITLDASYAREASDTAFCALVEHELYHIGQEHDAGGQPKFTTEGKPKLQIRGHDVEEFVGIVRRYGVGAAAGATAALVEAAKQSPRVSRLDIARACGTCHLKVA